MRRISLAGLAIAGIAASMGFLPQFGSATRKLGDVATVDVPRKARLDAPFVFEERATWVGYRMSRVHTWAMGSGTPYRANLFIALHAPGATKASYDEALKRAERELNGGAEGWKQVETHDQWDIGQGRYTINMLNEPTWRIKYRDPSRRVSVLWQVYQKDWSLDDARAAVLKMVASVRVLREPDFSDIADRPRREAEERERRVKGAMDWLAQRGFAPLEPHRPLTREGITVEYMADPERRLMLYKPIAARPTATLPAYVRHGWRVVGDTGWEYHMPDNDYWPMVGTTRMLDATLPKPGPHHFLIRTIRLDVLQEADFHIADFFHFATTYRQASP